MLAVEGYIFEQWAQSRKQPLSAIIEEALQLSRTAGFRNIELNPAFFAAESRDRTLAAIRSQDLRLPSLYVGGTLHERAKANQTIDLALALGDLCRPFDCHAIVTNPDPKPGGEPKTDAELNEQADSLDRMGRRLSEQGFQLRVHHHTPQLENKAREWRHMLQHTNPEFVYVCVDVDWAYESGVEPLPFLKEVGPRLRELHVRSARNKLWLEDVEDSDIDYHAVAGYLHQAGLTPLIVVELAYRPQTVIIRSLEEDLRLSRRYVEQVFGVRVDV
jgi:inosose dehydratase